MRPRISRRRWTGTPRPGLSAASYAAAKKAADAGDAAAQFVVGAANLVGAGREKDPHSAAAYFSMSAFSKYPFGLFGLAVCMRDSVGMPESPKSALKYFEKAAAAGCARAENALGVCYYKGYGIRKDPEKAVGLFKKAANARCRARLRIARQGGIGGRWNGKKSLPRA